ncbi:S8 family peptidase [Kribbella monticola]|uniref:S8 family peptidase n=1 Tax=Kribbella monticola TaxID=2185285 RepID=UPI001E577B24|nr:S8 family serine peptidase [Kribbella monticola]
MRPIRWTAAAVGLAVVLNLAAVPAGASPPSRPTPAAQAGAASKLVRLTLITGDHVSVTSVPGRPDQIVFEPGRGSGSTAAVTSFVAGHTVVVPSAAEADVLSGRLDRTLFDVTTLIAEHRDDAGSATVPVIIRYAGSPATALGRARQGVVPGGAKARVLTSIGARATSVPKNAIADFWASLTPGPSDRVAATIQRVTLDRQYKASLDQSVPQIGGPAAWQRGLTGKGVKIAVLDTGLDTGKAPGEAQTHADFAGRIAATANFSDSTDTADRYGHGTHVASIAAGTGAASGGKYKGVAPDATLLIGKVLDDYGNGSTSGIIAGMEWAAAQGATIANLSLGGDPSDGTDELSLAVNRISHDTGMLMVIAAGNCWDSGPGQVSAPASADAALAVANLQRDGSVNDTSCRGPRAGDGALKPEISAPGTDIVAARSEGTTIGTPVGDFYTTLSGTSMASPHVAGTAALIAQAHPDWKADQLKNRLISTADPQDGSGVFEQGAGRVDADQSTDDSVTVDTAKLDLGRLAWPYPATDPVSRELSYSNPTGTPVTLQLAASLEPAKATPKLSTSQLVVPAHGSAKVTVTADRAGGGTGAFSGRITATAAGADPLVTLIGWVAEPELHNLTIKGVLRSGGPADADLILTRLDGPPLGSESSPRLRNGTVTVRVPPGKYAVSGAYVDPATDARQRQVILLVSPETSVTTDTTVTLDARLAKPVSFSVRGRAGLSPRSHELINLRKNAAGEVIESLSVYASETNDMFATPTPATTSGSSEFSSVARLEVPPYQARVDGTGFPAYQMSFAPRLTGTKTLPLYDAGTGTPDELAGAAGKLAMIAWTGTPLSGDLVLAAQQAGAAAVLFYDQDLAGVAPDDYRISGWQDDTRIPVLRTTRVAAQDLLARLKTGPVQVRLTGVAASPVVYDLMVPWKNRIPADLRVAVDPSRLARVDETFGSHVPDNNIQEYRWGYSPAGITSVGSALPLFKAPARRTSYLLANEVRWSGHIIQGHGDGSAYFEAMTSPRRYQPGARSSVGWTMPVANSGLPATPHDWLGVHQEEGELQVALSPFGHGPEVSGGSFAQFDQSRLTVDRNGVQVADTREGAATAIDAPAEAADYKVSLDTRREFEDWKYSTRVQSVWSFRSSGSATEVMPLVLADLDVPKADDLNRVQTGVPVSVTLGLRHQTGPKGSAFTSASLEISYDGTTWTPVPLEKTAPGRYRATVNHPAAKAGTSPSLRLTATDSSGGKLQQEVTKAYGLK